jgi:type VI secretion system protein ImpE
MNATELYQAGRLDEAIQALGAGLRSDPTDARRRTFLFELLCFAGEYDRAEKHLDVLASSGKDADMGALLYRSALHAERTRQAMFASGETPGGSPAPPPVAGTLNGREFQALTDADPRVGARLEIFAAGQYTWLPLESVESVRMQAPSRLRDLLWAPAIVRTTPKFSGLDLGEVLVPVLTPLAWRSADPDVRLGRVTDWEPTESGKDVPVGQRLLLVDGDEFPILEVRELVIAPADRA